MSDKDFKEALKNQALLIGSRIRESRKAKKMKQNQLAELLGVAPKTIYKYEKGLIKNIPSDRLEQIAELLEVSPFYLMGWDENVEPYPISNITYVDINVYGSVPAGIPVEAVENIIGTVQIPATMLRGNKKFIGLKVTGSSMYPRYLEDDIIIVEMTCDVKTGDDVIVYINGYDATLKTMRFNTNGTISLVPINPEYETKTYGKNEIDQEVRILGKVVELRRKI